MRRVEQVDEDLLVLLVEGLVQRTPVPRHEDYGRLSSLSFEEWEAQEENDQTNDICSHY